MCTMYKFLHFCVILHIYLCYICAHGWFTFLQSDEEVWNNEKQHESD